MEDAREAAAEGDDEIAEVLWNYAEQYFSQHLRNERGKVRDKSRRDNILLGVAIALILVIVVLGIVLPESAVFVFGVAFICVLIGLAIFYPQPTSFQYTVFRIVLALAAAGVAAFIPGLLELELGTWLRAGGAIAVFVIVYRFLPAALATTSGSGATTAGDSSGGSSSSN